MHVFLDGGPKADARLAAIRWTVGFALADRIGNGSRSMTDRLDSFTRSQWIVIEDDAGIVRRAPFETLLFSIPIRVANGPEGPRIHRLDTGEALPVLRRYGYVWSALDPAPRPLFEVPEFDEAGRRFTPCGPVGVKTSALRVIENFS